MAEAWHLTGTVFVACNCDWGCPCNFNARPSRGKCEGGWTWHVERGSYGDAALDGLNFSVYVNWPGAIHEGNGAALILFDERADERQRAAIHALVGGTVGGPWGILARTWPTISGPHPVPYDVELNGVNSRIRCGTWFDIEGGPIRNPVTGNEAYPSVVLPQGIIFKQGDLGASKHFRVNHDVVYDHSGQYTAIGAFNYQGP